MVELQKTVDFDVKELTFEILAQKMNIDDIIIPDYQRKKIWSEDHRSRFIESIVLGFPVPFLFLADKEDGRLEIIDGYQRLSTIQDFLNNKLRLDDLEKLTTVIGFKYEDFPASQRRKLNNRTIRAIVLSDKSDPNVRFDIFERINSGSMVLSAAEFRKGAFRGPFYDLVLELSEHDLFEKLCPVGRARADRGEKEELVLRYFAYAERYRKFRHDVTNFLNNYIRDKNKNVDIERKRHEFNAMIGFVQEYFPYGFRKSKSARSTPRVRFEAISVGAHLALKEKPNLRPRNADWLHSDEFQLETTTHASNSAPRLRSRIEFVRDALMVS